MKMLREDVSSLTKLINLRLMGKSRQQNITELTLDGFCEFLLQIAHRSFNFSHESQLTEY
jgi:hypothetical protein